MVTYLNLHTIATFLAGLLIGGMIFFSFAVAPVVFKTLPRDDAATLMRAAFPVYYRVMATLSLLAALLIYYRPEALRFGLIGLLFIGADLGLRPRIDRLRTAARSSQGATARSHFRTFHGVSVVINLVQLTIAVLLFFRLAA